jgi:glycosyltransferase involved in cell wall biosynthesis
MKKQPIVLLLGKLPPPFMGPAIATEILLRSALRDRFRLVHLDTRAHRSLTSMGNWSIRKAFRTLSIYLRMKWLLLRHRPDVVIIPISQSTLGFFKDSLYLWIAKAFFRKVIFHLRGSNFRTWYAASGTINKAYVRWVLRRIQGVIVQGEKLRPIFEGLVPSEIIHVVPNGADYPMIPSPVDHDPLTVLYLANLQPSKGIRDVLDAVALLVDQGLQGFRLEVVGSWRNAETQRTCQDFVQQHHLPVRFHPAASGNEKYRFLQGADVFVFTPRDPEGHPWVIVEAQAAGLPVIATDRGAIAEAVADGVNGYIVEAASPRQLAERLKVVLTDKEMRMRMGRAARNTYEEKYTEAAMVENMSAAILKTLNYKRV